MRRPPAHIFSGASERPAFGERVSPLGAAPQVSAPGPAVGQRLLTGFSSCGRYLLRIMGPSVSPAAPFS
jgi:hypothetical protein